MMNRFEDVTTALRQAYVDMLKEAGHIRSARVEAAFRAVPRHLFLPDKPLDEVYSKGEFGIQCSDGRKVGAATSSYYVAEMLELVNLEPGQCVLEIGAGSGYNAALIAQVVGETGRVITIDIEEELVAKVNAKFKTAGIHWAQAICCDGALGYPEAAPYDLTLMTTGVWDIAPAWLEQLKPGGRMFVPLQFRAHTQGLIEFERSEGCLKGISRKPTQFSPMRGTLKSPADRFDVGPKSEDYLYVWMDDRDPNGVAEAVYKLMRGPSKDWPAEMSVTMREIRSLMLWLAVREPGYCLLFGGGKVAETGLLPCLTRFEFWPGGDTCGLLGDEALCVLMRPPGQPPRVTGLGIDDPVPFGLFVRSFGRDDALAHQLIDQIRAWDKAGRPSPDEVPVRVRAYPRDSDYVPSADELVIDKQFTRLVINWP